MNSDHVRGGLRHLKGRAETAYGSVTGRPSTQIRGLYDQGAGAAQYAYGSARERASHLRDEAGERLDHAARKGARRADAIVHRAQSAYDSGREIGEDLLNRGETALQQGQAYGRKAGRYARDHQASTVLLAVAGGALLAWLLKPSR